MKIAVLKTGWCDFYNGDVVKGAHDYIKSHKDGHERYNFKPGPDGIYYGYTPPISDKYAPAPTDKNDWLVFVLAKKPKEAGLYLVGWYENAVFADDYTPRPEYQTKPATLERDAGGGQFSYILSATTATLIAGPDRIYRFVGSHMKRAPIYYLRGTDAKDPWRQKLAQELLKAKATHLKSTQHKAIPRAPQGGICADAERRKETENAAVALVQSYYAKRYTCIDRQHDNCGYDLHFVHRKTGEELHVEVKGTAGTRPHFFISSNEHNHAKMHPFWRLAMVTEALGEGKLEVMDYKAASKRFRWDPFVWHATERSDG